MQCIHCATYVCTEFITVCHGSYSNYALMEHAVHCLKQVTCEAGKIYALQVM